MFLLKRKKDVVLTEEDSTESEISQAIDKLETEMRKVNLPRKMESVYMSVSSKNKPTKYSVLYKKIYDLGEIVSLNNNAQLCNKYVNTFFDLIDDMNKDFFKNLVIKSNDNVLLERFNIDMARRANGSGFGFSM